MRRRADRGRRRRPSAAPRCRRIARDGGSAAGWTAAGRLAGHRRQGENLDTVSRRYGVPSSAILSRQRAFELAGGQGRYALVVPVYNAGGRAVAAAKEGKGVRPRLGEAR